MMVFSATGGSPLPKMDQTTVGREVTTVIVVLTTYRLRWRRSRDKFDASKMS
jgi:hypothetical protein